VKKRHLEVTDMDGMNIFDLTGKVALVTGASRGLGRALARAMAQFGADVACVGRDSAKLAETLADIGTYGHAAIAIEADITDEEAIKNMVKETVNQLGKIDIFFNNAGMTTPFRKIHEIPAAEWDLVINTNLRGAFLALKYVVQVMREQKSGSIINISSIAGLRAEVPEVGPAQYGASKAAIMNLTQVAAIEYAPDGIRVNCIAPGMHKSELGSQNRPRTPDPEMEKRMQGFIADYCKQWIPLGRQADAEELTGLAVLLASDASGYITGQVFAQDGGQSARL
jgi:NAD(P)-dependent dehydrogenase (short-subunit alcohol dehydrogenase family)